MRTILVMALAACSGLTACRQAEPPPPAAAAQPTAPAPPSTHFAVLLAEFTPVPLSNCTFERIGDPNDGGYVMCGNLLSRGKAAYSYGIANNDEWGCSLSRRLGVPVHQYDYFDTRTPACQGGTPVFHAECVGPARVTEDGRLFDTVHAQIARNGDSGKRLVMKMDVEGEEWPSLLAIPGVGVPGPPGQQGHRRPRCRRGHARSEPA